RLDLRRAVACTLAQRLFDQGLEGARAFCGIHFRREPPAVDPDRAQHGVVPTRMHAIARLLPVEARANERAFGVALRALEQIVLGLPVCEILQLLERLLRGTDS